MSKWGIKISQEGKGVFDAPSKDLVLTTQLDMYRIAKTGTFTISTPEETKSSGSSSFSATYTHNIGYVPLFMPDIESVLTYTIFDDVAEVVANDSANDAFIGAGGPPATNEKATLKASSTQLIFTVDRVWDYAGTFYAHNVICYYTIFYNKMEDVFNLVAEV